MHWLQTFFFFEIWKVYSFINSIWRHFQLNSLDKFIKNENNILKLYDMSELCMKRKTFNLRAFLKLKYSLIKFSALKASDSIITF